MKPMWSDYLELCKPRVVTLMILTSLVGMCLTPVSSLPLLPLIFGNIGIALVAGAAAALNHVADQHIDRLMQRTQYRPIVQGKISTRNSIIFAIALALIGSTVLMIFTNLLTTVLTVLSLIGYAVCYTLYLKHATPQNIVIGGIAGAIPPLLGWTAITGSISAQGLLLVLIIYIWTPPHFWALAIHRCDDYAKANVPMLPVTHGIPFTKLNIVLYTILLILVTSLPYFIGMSGWIYMVGVSIANLVFLIYSLRLYFAPDKQFAMGTFKYSIYYLGILFLLLLVDHFYGF